MADRYLSVATMFRSENRRLQEWLDYHRMVGVGHFFLFENHHPGDPDPLYVLGPYIEAGVVSYYRWPGTQMQVRCHTWIATRPEVARSRWLALIDVDEFLYPMEGSSVPNALAHYDSDDSLAAVGLSWAVFGSSGHRTPPELQVESFVHRSAMPGPDDGKPRVFNRCVKSVVRPGRVVEALSAHHFRPRHPYRCINERGGPLDSFCHGDPSWDRLRVNHYRTRSLLEFEEKLRRGDAQSGHHARLDDRFEWDSNEVYDPSARRLVPALREAMGRAPRWTAKL